MRLRVTETISMGAARARGVMNDRVRRRSAAPAAAFTLIEIAICLGVIGFALVAIIGILPAGLQVQRDNREDTIINQEGTYLLEAIKNGAEGLEGFAKRVDLIVITNVTQAKEENRYDANDIDDLEPHEVVGFLSMPSDETADILELRVVIAAAAGALLDTKTDLAFKYQVTIRNFAYTNSNPWDPPGFQKALADRTRDIRLDMRWPMLGDGKPGIGRQNFRALASGYLIRGERVRGSYPWYLRQKE